MAEYEILCPLRKAKKGDSEEFQPCMGEKCAWWLDWYNMCAVMALSLAVQGIDYANRRVRE